MTLVPPWREKMPTQNLLILLLLLMLMMRIMLATVCCRFGSWGLVIKVNFCSDLEHKVWSRFWSWSSGMICMVKRFSTLEKSWLSCRHWLPLSLTDSLTPSLISLQFVCDEMLLFGWNFEVSAWSRLWRRNLICFWTCDVTHYVTLLRWTQPSGPLCLWQCFSNRRL